MSKNDDEFIEELLRGLPKAEPMSEFEIRKFEKLIDKQTDAYVKANRKSSLKLPVSIAASVAIAFGAAFLLTNHSSVVNTNGQIANSPIQPITTASPETQSTSPAKTQGGSTKPKTQSSTSNEVFGDSGQTKGEDGKVQTFQTNLDYENQIIQIKKIVEPALTPGSITSLTYAAQQCAIKQGISDSVLAFDKGYFQGQRVSAYFTGSNKKDFKIVLVDSNCEVISQ